MDTRLYQFGDEAMAKGMEVGDTPLTVTISEKIRRGPFVPFQITLGFINPISAGVRQITLNQITGFVVLRPFSRPELRIWRLPNEPGNQEGYQFGMKREDVFTSSLLRVGPIA